MKTTSLELSKKLYKKKKQHPLYVTWTNMRQRCNNPKHIQYSEYGGRGIKVCERWNNFTNFLEDMGEKPTPQHSIDRIDNDLGYSPENCRWATKQEQVINRGLQKNNKSGFRGVFWDKSRNAWLAYIQRDRKFKTIGRFETKEEAAKARENYLCELQA